jgi:hypothetical protein
MKSCSAGTLVCGVIDNLWSVESEEWYCIIDEDVGACY